MTFLQEALFADSGYEFEVVAKSYPFCEVLRSMVNPLNLIIAICGT